MDTARPDEDCLLLPLGSSPLALRCPACGHDYIHHIGVEVFSRFEDAPRVAVTCVDAYRGHVTHRIEPSGWTRSRNPSGRRHGVAIKFECEGCEALSELTIDQNRGETFVGTRLATTKADWSRNE